MRAMARLKRARIARLAPLLVLLLRAALVEAADEPPTLTPATPGVSTPATASGAIPVPEVATRAAQVPDLLRGLTAPLAEGAETDVIKRRLEQARAQIDLELATAATLLRSHPTLDVIQLQQQLWQQRQLQTSEWLSALTRRATLLQDTLRRLSGIKTTWRQTREASLATDAPAAILAQIDGALAAIDTAEAPLTAQRTAILDLQSVVAQEVARSADMLAQFTQAQQRAMGGILARDTPAIWSAEAWDHARGTLRARVRELRTTRRDDLIRYIQDPSRGLPLHVLILVGLVVVLLAARRQVRRSGESEAREALGVLTDHPYAAAFAVTLLFLSAPISTVPQSLRNLSEVLTLVPVIRLMRSAIDPRLMLLVYSLALLFTVDSVRQVIGGVPALEQTILVLEMVAGIGVLTYTLWWGALRRRSVAQTERLRTFRASARIVVVVLAAGLVAGASGYMRLARLLASGLLSGGALALTLSAAVQVLAGLMALALGVWPLRLLRMVQHHRELLERRAYRVLLWSAIVAWGARVLDYAGLFQPALLSVKSVLAAPLGRGAISFSVGDVLEFVLTVWVAYLISAFIRFVLQEDIYPRTKMTRGISYAVSNLLNYIILALGFLLALGAIGLDLTKATILAGAFGVGIGFGLQSIVNNFVSGLILLFERPIRVGDVVEVGNLQGEVTRIGIRASTVRTGRGAEIIVPNAQLVTDRVTNWTASDRLRRIEIPVGVDYGSAPEKVVEVLEGVARRHPEVLTHPPPQAVFTAFGDSAINFELRAWTNHFERWARTRQSWRREFMRPSATQG
jgi:small-conductance mechanosensitive channel